MNEYFVAQNPISNLRKLVHDVIKSNVPLLQKEAMLRSQEKCFLNFFLGWAFKAKPKGGDPLTQEY